ncbi:MAG: DUF1624 domain-containing protein [Elusimicrobia bacterium]|nr:DUF1624 domain-containing protein [Elusimicrobiota bacterium]
MERLRALDLFRGLTVAGMILVNCSGSDEVFPLLDHAPWHGLTLADLVFPSFLVVLGVSAALSFAARRARGGTPAGFAAYSARRALALFALGLFVNVFVFREAHGIRWPGVLQRIALCALGTSGFLLLDRPALEPAAVAALLGGYWLLLTRVPVPGHGAGALTPEGNLASWLDRALMGGHLETPLQDPEGLLSTLPALATSLIGLAAGRRLAADGGARAAPRLAAAGVLLAALGGVWARSFPLNKHLWTSSYALVAGGLCLAGLGTCLALSGESPPRGGRALEALGRHALAAYVLSGWAYGVLEFLPARLPDGSAGNAKLWLTATLFAPWLAPRLASLAFALAFVAASAAVALRADPGK